MNIQEFKNLYPEYNDMSLEEFAKKTHQKYYSDIPWTTFQIKSGLKPIKILQPIDERKYAFAETAKGTSLKFGQELISAVETGAALAMMPIEFIASTIPGWAGIIEGLRTGDTAAAAEATTKIQAMMHPYLSYQPITEAGKRGVETVKKGFELLSQFGQWLTTETGLKKYPTISTTIESFIELLPVIVAPFLFRQKGIKPVNPEDILRLEKEIDRVGQAVKEKVSSQGILESEKVIPTTKWETMLENFAKDHFPEIDEMGAILITPDEIKKAFEGIKAKFDQEAPFKAVGAPETGYNVKNYYSQRALWEQKGLEVGKEIGKLSKEQRSELVLLTEKNRKFVEGTPFEKAYDAWHKGSEEALRHLSQLKILKDKGWPQTAIDRLIEENEILTKKANKIKQKSAKQDFLDKIEENEEIISRLKDLKFVHIPVRYWFADKAGRDPSWGTRTLRYLARRQRKTVSIGDLVDEGFLKSEDMDMMDVVTSYYRRVGKDIALGRIIQSAINEKLLTTKPVEGTIELPTYRFPILKGYYADPVFADYLYRFLNNVGRQGTIENVLGSVKMMQFYNPLFLPMYDTIQATMLRGLDPKSYPKLPKHIYEGIRDIVKKTPEYWEALDNGLASKPFNNPLDSYQRMMDMLKSENKTIWAVLRKYAGPQSLRQIYNHSWNTAWMLDNLTRQISYRYLLDKGFNSREAAQIAAKFHSDYASVPPAMRRVLNHIFFTPTFKITMAKLFDEMIEGLPKTGFKLGKVSQRTKIMAKGAITTFGIIMGIDAYWRSQGFQCDQFGRRYFKRVEVADPETGETSTKELVITWSNPANMWLKYWFRGKQALEPDEKTGIKKALEMNKWEFHPLYRVGYELTENKDEKGDNIVNPFDSNLEKALKRGRYIFTRIVRITGLLDKTKVDPKAHGAMAKEIGQLQALIWRPFSFAYLRSPKEERIYWKVRGLERALRKQIISGKGIEESDLNEFNKQLDTLLNELHSDQVSETERIRFMMIKDQAAQEKIAKNVKGDKQAVFTMPTP